ncbi:MAG: hypothetical protein OEM28_07325 [Nitrosopumilus sp.]|nr:hypothetical protein [Nitrosopumilus sp.]MDH3488073.1 hypothetical protein [Nitrosopumilus sp.]
MKEAYERSQSFLIPFEENNETANEKDKKELFLETWREQAKLYGIDPMKIKIEKQRIVKNTNVISKTSTDNEIDAIKTTIHNIIRKNRADTEIKPIIEYESKIASDEEELLSYV